MEDLSQYSYDELTAELKRRDEIHNRPWPRRVTIEGELDFDWGNEELLEVTEFQEGSVEADQALSPLYNMKVVLEVGPGGESRIVEVDGRRVED